MSETNNFLIQKHNTQNPHFDLFLEIDGEMLSWIVPNGIPENTKEKKIAVELETNKQGITEEEYIASVKDPYGEGPVELWDKGKFEAATNKNIKIILKPEGDRFIGKYILHVPNWGRWTKRRLWTIEKIS